MAQAMAAAVRRWIEAGLIDSETAARIQAFELAHAGSVARRWPIWIALAFGAAMLGAGVLLFVSAHWDTLSPDARFALVLALVAFFHVTAAATRERFAGMAATLHVVGTVALGAGIFLAGQVFNLNEHWPGGLMLWALGAAIAWALLRDWPQFALTAILLPAWLLSEWFVAASGPSFFFFLQGGAQVAACGAFLLAITYFTAAVDRASPLRRVLLWLGGVSVLPAALALAAARTNLFGFQGAAVLSSQLVALGWTLAIGLPLLLAFALRRTTAWPNVVAALWAVEFLRLGNFAGDITPYLFWAAGAIALTAWGVADRRRERIDIGAVIFAATVLTFYFSQVMDKLGRSVSLVGLGLLFLAGGWALEQVRRRLVLRTQGARS